MPKFAVYGIATGSKYLGTFEAETREEAEDMAANSEANSICLCHQCASEIELDDFSFQEFTAEETE